MIGFFQDEGGDEKGAVFCMRKKDVRAVKKRFQAFYSSWKEFQMKDLVVKRVAVSDSEMTFKPELCTKSKHMLP